MHPMHGAGTIQAIVKRKVEGRLQEYYALKLLLDDMVLYLPIGSSDEIGIRSVCSVQTAQALLQELPELSCDEEQYWNRRYRENMLRIRSGDLHEVARVIKSLVLRQQSHGLSNGEKKMLCAAQRILASELSLALHCTPNEIENILQTQLCR